MRITSAIWVSAYLRRCSSAGIPGVVARRGDEHAGAIYIKVSLLDGTVDLYVPAPQAVMEDNTRRWMLRGPAATESDAEGFLDREIGFDPDIWIVETEDRDGRHMLGEELAGDDDAPDPGAGVFR